MNTAIIDDSIEEARQLSNYVRTYCSNVHLEEKITIFTSPKDFLSQWKAGAFQLVFLDIYLGDVPVGLKIAQQIRKDDLQCLIVFTTRCKDLAFKGYEVRATDYLIKPITYQRLSQTMDYVRQSLSTYSYYIEVKESRIQIRIPLDQILYADYSNHYILIHTEKRIVKTYMRFEDFAKLLQPYPQFVPCRRNCMVNLDQIQSLEKNEVLLKNGVRIPIGHIQRSSLIQQYADYQFSQNKR